MEDNEILALFDARSDRAVAETERKYGALCRAAVRRVLNDGRDAEECVNDTWMALWNAIPPARPSCLPAYISRIACRIAVSRYRYLTREKRREDGMLSLDELEECVPDPEGLTEGDGELKETLSAFLASLEEETRNWFLSRYLYQHSPSEIASAAGVSENTVVTRLYRARKKLEKLLKRGKGKTK